MDFVVNRPQTHPVVRFVLGVALASAVALILPLAAFAADVRSGDDITIGPSDVVTDDLYAFGANVLVQGTVQGDVIAAGSNVTINGHVTGSVMAAGGALTVNGPVDGSVRVAGNRITLGAPVGTDVLVAGSAVTLNPVAEVGRDLLAAGTSMTVQAPVARNVMATGGTLTLGSSVGGAVEATVSNLVIESGASIEGPVAYVSAQPATVSPGANLQQPVQRTEPPTTRSSPPWMVGGLDIFGWLRGFVGLAIFGSLLALAFPRAATTVADTGEHRWLASLGLGFALLVALPVLALFVFIIGLLIGGWWIGPMLLGVYAMLLVVAYVAFAEWVGLTALRINKRTAHPAAAMLLGVLIVSLVGLIPVLGPLVGLAAVLLGLGALTVSGWQAYRGMTATTPVVGTPAEPPTRLPTAA